MSLLVIPFLCIVFLSSSANAQVHFNSSINCTAGCYITDPAIYIGNLLPTPADEVFINVTEPTAIFIAPSNTSFNVTILHIYHTQLTIEPNATIDVIEELNLLDVLLHINESGLLVVQEEASFENSTFVSSGHTKILSLSLEFSALFGHNGSKFHFEEFEIEDGTVIVDEGSNFTALDGSDFDHTFIYFGIAPFLGEVEFESVNANFPVGFYAEGQYLISGSNFTAYFPDALANVSFILAGKNNLNVSNLHFNSDKIKINQTGTPFITFNVNSNASFDGNLTVPGEIVINSGSNVAFNGTILLSGGISANVDTSTQITTTGNLTCGAISLVGHTSDSPNVTRNAATNTYSFIVTNAVLTAPSITLEKFVLHSYTGNTIINGSLINNGSVHIFETSSVIVLGNYTQFPNTTFGVYNLDNVEGRSINLVVNGSAILDGHIRYNTSEKEDIFTATVITATNNVTGSFATSEFLDNLTLYSPVVSYTPGSVDITINPPQNNPSKPWHQELTWWMWLLVGVGALALILVIIIVIRTVRKRAAYQAVATS